jgi:hypothetical protein
MRRVQRHLGDVDQALDAVLELDEGAVGHEVDDLALDAASRPGTSARSPPRGSVLLLEAEGDLLLLAVDVEDLDLDLLSSILTTSARVVDRGPRTCR